jgi:hypothetical protein
MTRIPLTTGDDRPSPHLPRARTNKHGIRSLQGVSVSARKPVPVTLAKMKCLETKTD